jgi:class 3 adenylate cyclase
MTIEGRTTTRAVTFLFTDIEGSSRIEREVGTDAYATLLARHRAILRAAFSANGGEEMSTEGDSFFVVFSSAADAIRAAVDGQRGLAAADWPEGSAVRVRVGVHTGEAPRRRGPRRDRHQPTAGSRRPGTAGSPHLGGDPRPRRRCAPAGVAWRDLGRTA